MLSIVGIPARYRIEFATYMFSGEADHWWDAMKDAMDVSTLEWERFEEMFLGDFIPQAIKSAKEDEFMKLEQREITVSQYAAKFAELSRFAPDMVATEEKKTKRFEKGLKPYIRSKLNVLEIRRYSELLNKALVAEQYNEEMQRTRSQSRKKDKEWQSKGGAGPTRHQPPRQQQSHQTPYQRSQGGQSSGVPSGSKGRDRRTCFGCRGTGHLVRSCPSHDTSQTQAQSMMSQSHQSPCSSHSVLSSRLRHTLHSIRLIHTKPISSVRRLRVSLGVLSSISRGREEVAVVRDMVRIPGLRVESLPWFRMMLRHQMRLWKVHYLYFLHGLACCLIQVPRIHSSLHHLHPSWVWILFRYLWHCVLILQWVRVSWLALFASLVL